MRRGISSLRFVHRVLAAIAAGALAPTAGAGQVSHTCEFALAGWLGTQIELREGRAAYQACLKARVVACTAEQGRVRLLEERLRLLRGYVDRYCRR